MNKNSVIKTTWYSEYKDKHWNEPVKFNSPINTLPGGMLPSFSANGNMYFSKRLGKENGSGEIFFSKFIDGKYSKAVALPGQINTSGYDMGAVISPDESYIIFYSMGYHPEGSGQYISFRNNKGEWSEAVNMGDEMNSGGIAFISSLSPDGKYLFFLLRQNSRMKFRGKKREEGIYWIDTEYIKKLKAESKNK